MTQPAPSKSLSPVLRRTLDLVQDDPRTLDKLTADAGVSRNTPYQWGRRRAASLGAVEAMLGAMGYRLEVVPAEDVATQRSAPNDQPDTVVARTKRHGGTRLSPGCTTIKEE